MTETSASANHSPAPRSEVSLEAYLAVHGLLPVPDRSTVKRNRFISRGQADLGTWTSVIEQGDIKRPLVVETWADQGNVTCQTCFFSRIGLEDETAESVLEKFRGGGAIEGPEIIPCELVRMIDASGHPIWSFTICIASDDMSYVTKAFPRHPFPDSVFSD